MLDDSWKMGTRFGTYVLSFDETLQSARGSRRTHLTFDIVGITYWHENTRHDFLLDARDQRIVRLVLEQEQFRPRLQIKDIQSIQRCDARPRDMENSCRNIRESLLHSSNGLHHVSFRDWEWDYLGKIGSFSHGWNSFWWTADHHPFLFILCVLLTVVAIRKFVTQAHRRGFRYLRRADGDFEEAVVEEIGSDGLSPGKKPTERARSPLSITIHAKS
ncbi:hypothetical protein EV356DRAFT_331728 [Viridothelium virens]|uniref:Transmembrane protein n=1 Tax=Viridothelium virens TaxID=1048519 RepID=A0A6A6HJB6_VIRVR|nr:hypothetical protein EV356DRAFT_331728 [Viridothelium virens]